MAILLSPERPTMLLVVEGPDQAERPLVKVAGYADQPLPPERGVNPRARSTIAASEDPALEPKKLSSPWERRPYHEGGGLGWSVALKIEVTLLFSATLRLGGSRQGR
jgi:hypothetical protein